MTREIKFRGKDPETKGWLYGDLIQRLGYHPSILFRYNLKGKVAYCERSVIPKTVGQFTGQYDKNKDEIYEKDILCLNHNGSNYLVVVEWNNEVSAWCIRFETERIAGVKPLGEWLCDYSMEVVGSIHDNPELLHSNTKNIGKN